MEDRHYLSDPRPVKGLDRLTWDVDVMREGVDQPIMTVRLDSETLPPRKRKKKIVWQLPDTWDQIPKFGKEDKLRILELFKQQKRSTKKEKRKSQATDAEPQDELIIGGNDAADDYHTTTVEERSSVPASHDPPSYVSPRPPSDPNTNQKSEDYGRPPGFEALSLEEKKSENVHDHVLPEQSPTTLRRPPGMPESFSPGHHHQGHQPTSPATITRHLTPPGIPFPVSATVSPNLARYFQIPQHGSPTTMATTLADIVTQSYYTMLTHGHVLELKRFFTASATKSLTVGGAHAICTSEEDKDRQLQSLVGIVMAVRGVLQQTIPTSATMTPPPSMMTPDGIATFRSNTSPTMDSVLIVITGVCMRPYALPFCHTLVLVGRPEGYQIQNDALCFLTPTDSSSVE